jgi:branched-chain amino acid transport system substrate-binding protein
MAGHANANVAKMVIQDINDAGGVLGRPIELHIEDTASNESVAVANVRKLIQRDKVDVVLGGITSSMRNAIKDVIVTRGKTLYIYPQLYEGKECMPYLFCTGPTPAQQCDDFIPWLIKNGGRRFALPSANYVWPHVLNAYARQIIEKNGGEVVFEEYYPLDQVEYSATVHRIMTNNVDVVFNTVIPPGVGPSSNSYTRQVLASAEAVSHAFTMTMGLSSSTRLMRWKDWLAALIISGQ